MQLASPTSASAPASRPPLVTAKVAPLPKDLPAVDSVPVGTTDHEAPQRWFDWNLATMTWQDGFSRETGEPVFDRQRVVAAPYAEYRDAVQLDRALPFEQVVAIAQARAGFDVEGALGTPQAILQAKDGAWFLVAAGYQEQEDHIEPISLDLRPKDMTIRQHVRELMAIVDQQRWADFTDA